MKSESYRRHMYAQGGANQSDWLISIRRWIQRKPFTSVAITGFISLVFGVAGPLSLILVPVLVMAAVAGIMENTGGLD